jgi:hypothetical protein
VRDTIIGDESQSLSDDCRRISKPSLVYDTHTAATKLLDDAVVGDDLPDERVSA